MLKAESLRKCYGEFVALEGLDLTVATGEVTCLLGANGAGKTTTLSLFLGLQVPTSGVAYVDGVDVIKHPKVAKSKLAYLPEQVMLYKHLSGFENLEYFSSLGRQHQHERSFLLECLERVGLPKDAVKKPLGNYSKGMRQKVGIAITIAKGAKALLLDEPTSGLDPLAANELSKILEDLRASGVAILMATHDLFRAQELGSTLIIMRQGQVIERLKSTDLSPSDLERVYVNCMRSEHPPARGVTS